MNEYIDSLKIKLIAAVDLNQKKINKISDIKEALKELESFPMTLDILNSSRIGKIVNDIRHFNDAQSDIKTRLKDLIKQWNEQLLPHKNKKPNKISKPSNSNGCNKPIKVSESSNISHYNNENYKEKHLLPVTKTKSSNHLEIMNGKKKTIRDDCDNSCEIPNKKQRLDLKISYTESPKTLLKEIHLDVDSCPPTYKTNNLNLFTQKHDSPASLHFPDVKRFIKREEEHQINVSPSLNKDKLRKRKNDLPYNGVTATPLQKVKSTRELLAEMGDLVGSDTKKKILCNEIAFEDDIPKSCIPESVRPKPKLIKQTKSAQNVESNCKTVKYSPKIPINNDDDFLDFSMSNRPESTEQQIKLERSSSYGNIKDHHKLTNNHTLTKYSPYNQNNNSPSKDFTKRSPASDNHAQSVATPTLSDDLEKCSLKIKIPLKPYKKKSKHHDPPITNRMDDLPTLPDLNQIDTNLDDYFYDTDNQKPIEMSDQILELFAHFDWEGYNCTRHPITKELNGFCDTYKVEDLTVLAWTDKVYECPSFFPVNTEGELGWLESAICEYS